MRPRARMRLLGGGFALLALVGLWLGHSLEYVRVWGARGLSTELVGSVHAYMLPAGLVLAVVGAAASLAAWRFWNRLGRRLDTARRTVRQALLGRPHPQGSRPPRSQQASTSSRILLAWPALTAVQVALYLAQENLEAIRAGLAAPGFGAITGVHALAPAVHAAVALLLLLAVALVAVVFRRRSRAIAALEGRLARLQSRRSLLETPRPPATSASAPLQLLGPQLWCRPPPLPAV